MQLNEAFDLYRELVLSSSSPRAQKTELGRWKNHLKPILGEIPLESINSQKVLRLEAELRKKNLAPQTVYHCLSLLRRVLNRAVEWELYSGPVPKIRMPKFNNKRMRFLSKSEARQLLAELKRRSPLWHDIALFALNTGLRRGEILALTPAQIDLNAALCHVLDSKTYQGRAIPLNDQAKSLVLKHMDENPSKPIFKEQSGAVNPHARYFRQAVNACGLNAGITDRRAKVCFHSLRHTFASWLVQAGVRLQVVSHLLGHTSLKMTLRYAHLAPDEIHQAVDILCLS